MAHDGEGVYKLGEIHPRMCAVYPTNIKPRTIKLTVLSREQARKRLGVSMPTLDKLVASGNGPQSVRLGRRVLIDADSLDNWFTAHLA